MGIPFTPFTNYVATAKNISAVAEYSWAEILITRIFSYVIWADASILLRLKWGVFDGLDVILLLLLIVAAACYA